MKETIEIRTMVRREIDFAVNLAAAEGWNPGLHDGDCFYRADTDGFLLALLKDKPIGCISAVSYPGQFGFIGFYIVLPEYRGRGFGVRLWNSAMKRLEGHTLGLDGVFEQQDNYRRSGFQFAYRNIRFEYRGGPKGFPDSEGVRDLNDFPFGVVLDYDRRCFPADRRVFLSHWLNQPQAKAFGCGSGERLKGYGLIRKCRAGYKIGPLFADDSEKALALFRRLSACAGEGEPVYLDVPEANSAGMKLARALNMKMVFGTARMYKGPFPETRLEKVFGVTSFELG